MGNSVVLRRPFRIASAVRARRGSCWVNMFYVASGVSKALAVAIRAQQTSTPLMPDDSRFVAFANMSLFRYRSWVRTELPAYRRS